MNLRPVIGAGMVSVIIPTFNRCELVQQAIASVLAQTASRWEIIVVDDGSTDDTEHALDRWRDCIRYVRQDNQGESAARNHGIRLARGEYIAFLDSDDLWLPAKLARQIERFEQDQAVGLVFCQAFKIDGAGIRLPGDLLGAEVDCTASTFEHLCRRNFLAPSTVVMRRAVIEAAGGFDETIQYGEDWDLWLRTALVNKIAGIAEPLASIRLHQGGQWWFPKRYNVARVLEDHLRLLNRAFALNPDQSTGMVKLRDGCLAREYGAAALANYAFGQPAPARAQLQEAIRLDPTCWGNLDYVADELAGFALRLGQMNPADLQAPRRYIHDALQQLPPQLARLASAERRLAAQVDVELGYHFLSIGDFPQARRYLSRGVTTDIRWLRNRGVDKTLLKLWLGERGVAWTRRIAARRSG